MSLGLAASPIGVRTARYRTYDDAEARRNRVVDQYNARHGCSLGDLRIVKRLGRTILNKPQGA